MAIPKRTIAATDQTEFQSYCRRVAPKQSDTSDQPMDGSASNLEEISIYRRLWGSAIVLPFGLIKVINHFSHRRIEAWQPELLRDQNSMKLMSNGWAIGNPNSCQFFDWRDIHAFYHNKSCFGFRTFNDLVQVIPKRIFETPEEAETLFNTAISFRREHLRSFEDKPVGREAGNPYQPPFS